MTTVPYVVVATTSITLSTSPRFGTLSATCTRGNLNDHVLRIAIANTTTDGSRLHIPNVGGVLTSLDLYQATLTVTDQNVAAFFHVMRFATNLDGSPSFSVEQISVGGERLANGDCRVSLAIDE